MLRAGAIIDPPGGVEVKAYGADHWQDGYDVGGHHAWASGTPGYISLLSFEASPRLLMDGPISPEWHPRSLEYSHGKLLRPFCVAWHANATDTAVSGRSAADCSRWQQVSALYAHRFAIRLTRRVDLGRCPAVGDDEGATDAPMPQGVLFYNDTAYVCCEIACAARIQPCEACGVAHTFDGPPKWGNTNWAVP